MFGIAPEFDNPFFAGLCEENDMSERVMDCVRYISCEHGDTLTLQEMEDALDRYGIEYCALPRHLRAEFDYFEIAC